MEKTIVIVGASADRRKYGNKAVRAFRDGGWKVYPVNPKEKIIEGIRCYASLKEIPAPVDRVSLYVPPSVGRKILDDIVALQPKEVFFNPGSEDDDLIREAERRGLPVVQACSIVNIGLRPEMYGDT